MGSEHQTHFLSFPAPNQFQLICELLLLFGNKMKTDSLQISLQKNIFWNLFTIPIPIVILALIRILFLLLVSYLKVPSLKILCLKHAVKDIRVTPASVSDFPVHLVSKWKWKCNRHPWKHTHTIFLDSSQCKCNGWKLCTKFRVLLMITLFHESQSRWQITTVIDDMFSRERRKRERSR